MTAFQKKFAQENRASRRTLDLLGFSSCWFRFKVFRGLFWFQGENDGGSTGREPFYAARWHGMLAQLEADLGSSSWNYLMNTVGNSGQAINDVLKEITDNDPRGVLFDTQKLPYKPRTDIHGYDHALVGKDNVALFNATFLAIPEPSSSFFILSSMALFANTRKRRDRAL